MGPGPILRPAAAAWAFPTSADPSYPPDGDHRVVAPRICLTSTDTRRWPGDDQPPVPRLAPTPVHRSETGRDFRDTYCSTELSECIGRGWGLVSGADDEHEPCLPSGGCESNGRSGRCVGLGWLCGTTGP